MPICNWCPSGLPWNQCTCDAARKATLIGFREANERFRPYQPGAGAEPALADAKGRTAGSIPATGAKGKKPRAADKIIEGLTEALQVSRGEAEPFRVTTFATFDDDTPLVNPACPSCIKKRAMEAAASAERVKRHRDRRKSRQPE